MPGVTFGIFNDCYSLDIGQSDWIAAQTERTGANNGCGYTNVPRWDMPPSGLQDLASLGRLLEVGQFRYWGAIMSQGKREAHFWECFLGLSRMLGLEMTFVCLVPPLPNL